MKKLLSSTAALTLIHSFAFDNQPGWKLDADGNIELKDGNPIYIGSDGNEMTVGGDTISSLRKEAMTHREAKEEAEKKLKAFADLDPEKAKEAIEKLAQIDQKQLIDAGEVEKVREQMRGEFTEQLAEKDKLNETLQHQNDTMRIDDIFKSSEFVRDNIAVPQDMFQATFRSHFKVEEDKINVYGKDGNRVMSKERAGEYATPEEALKILVDQHSQKDVILKADDQKGSGGSGSGGMSGNSRTVRRSDMEQMTPAEQSDIAQKAGKGEVNIVD